jgi:exopolysaccharide production protein ExoZ
MVTRKTFFGIQVLRGVAATLVLAFHASLGLRGGYGLEPPPWVGFSRLPVLFFGNGGVDLFFLVSGFVIVWTTQDSWCEPHAWRGFLEKRLTRIFPLYWGLTSVKILFLIVAPLLFKASGLLPWNTIASFLLIPSRDAEGYVQPLITSGWTLCYEMFFYYACTACLMRKVRPIVTVTPLFLGLGVLGMFRTPAWPPIATLIDPLLWEFVAGMWIAELTRKDLVRGGAVPMVGLLTIGVLGLLASALLPFRVDYSYRVLLWGMPAAAILYATIALESYVDFRKFWVALLIGDASYSIYLSSGMLLQPLVARTKHLQLSLFGEWFALLLIVAIGILGGIAVWWAIETKLIRGILHLSKPMREAWVNPRRLQPMDNQSVL